MKTVMIFDQLGEAPLLFFVLDGDFSSLDGVYINSVDSSHEDCDRLSAIIYDSDGAKKIEPLTKFPVDAVREGADVIVAGFLP